MKHLKYFETINNKKLKKGYYVIACSIHQELIKFSVNNIGQIIKKSDSKIIVGYKTIPDNLIRFFNFYKELDYPYTREFPETSILQSSPNIKELEPFIQSDKYNL